MSIQMARRGAIEKGRRGITIIHNAAFSENFESYTTGTWTEASVHGPWTVRFVGNLGIIQVVTGKYLQLEAADPDFTSSGLVSTTTETYGDFDITLEMRTLAQLKASPNAWEVAWFCWHFTQRPGTGVEGQGDPTDMIRRFYYVALKPNGFEMGKVDQAAFLATGGQRFLWTDSTTYAVGTTWRTLRVKMTGARMQVWVEGVVAADFTDGPGSGGTPAWGTAGETVLTSGGYGLYHEDARAQFDDLATA